MNERNAVARVFISSVMREFEPYREAARRGVVDAGLKPILMEHIPSLDVSSRTACLDLVRSCDVYIAVIGDRAGSSPLGRPVVEEEFEEARKKKMPRLIFLQEVSRDAETNALAERLSDYVTGRFRATFDDPNGLRAAVNNALRGLSLMNIEKNDPHMVEEMLQRGSQASAPTLRLAFLPQRKDEVFDTLEFDRPDFRRSMFQLAHADDVRLFEFEQGTKEATVERDEFVLKQEPRRGGTDKSISIVVRDDGAILIEQTLRDHSGDLHGFGFAPQVTESDIAAVVHAGVAFVNSLYRQRDPGERFSTFFFGAAASGMNMYFIVKERREQRSWSLRMEDERGWQMLEKPRPVDRTDFASPQELTHRVIAFMVKRYGERK
jgi:hypothetical protein